MHLQDEHLKTALQHAPDRDVQPKAHVRDAVSVSYTHLDVYKRQAGCR